MAKKKSGGGNSQGKDSQSQRLGIKCFAGEQVRTGTILVRQRGTKFLPGTNVDIGKDDTLFAIADGYVRYEHLTRDKQRVSVHPERQ